MFALIESKHRSLGAMLLTFSNFWRVNVRNRLVCVAAMAAVVFSAAAVFAADYSFEVIVPPNGPDGFFGLGATVSQEPTIGVTDLENSLKYEVGTGGFVGARTESVIPPTLGNPPGVVAVMFDITIPQTYTDTFANMGVTVFGHALNPGGPGTFGNQVQFANEYPMAGKAPGTYLNQMITLDLSVGPYRPGESFNQIFGPVDPNDLTVASAFQFYINKNVLTPITVYIDNVRFVIPEPASLTLLCLAVPALIFRRRR
jgi:hypothetical protein